MTSLPCDPAHREDQSSPAERLFRYKKRAAFKIHPGECLMQPGILLYFRMHKSIREGQNEFLRLMIAHFVPGNSRGELIKPPLFPAQVRQLSEGE